MISEILRLHLQRSCERSTAPDSARSWLDATLAAAESASADDVRLAQQFSAAGRNLSHLVPDAETHAALRDAGVAVPASWTAVDLGRALLIASALRNLPADTHVRFVSRFYRSGDNAERRTVLQSLVLLPDPDRFVDIGVDACRSHVQDVFEAIVCDNTYPARYFPELNFNQMILKALFTGAPVGRIVNWTERRTPELLRMVIGYASERKATGRSIPEDINLILDGATP
jgi:hypothetical protein